MLIPRFRVNSTFQTFPVTKFACRTKSLFMASTQLIMLYYTYIWLHVSTNHMVILKTYEHITTKLKLQISFWVRLRPQSYCFKVQINNILKGLKTI
jgi:hypothetical protein